MPADICTRPWEYRVEPFRILGNLYYVGNRDVSSHLIDTGEGLILLDTAFPQTVYLLLESIRELGFDPGEIRWIVHSHAHYDHCGGTRAIVELTSAKTALGRDDLFMLTDRPELTWAPEYGTEFHEFFAVDRLMQDGDRLALGNTVIECLHAPGHTPGVLACFFEVSEGADRYVVGTHGGPGLNTLTETYLTQYGLTFDARTQYLDSLKKLKKRHVDIFIGAHPGQSNTLDKRQGMTDAANPFIDATAWPRFLAQLEANARRAFGIEG